MKSNKPKEVNLTSTFFFFIRPKRGVSPRARNVWKLLATIYDAEAETKEDLAKAIEYCKKASSLDPSNAEIFLELAVLELHVEIILSARVDATRQYDII